MITRSKSKACLSSSAPSGKSAKGSSAPPLMPANKTDPFQVLDDVCIRTIFALLSHTDIVRCEAVSRLWRATAVFNLTGSMVRRDFPYAWETARFEGLDDDGRMTEFKRLVYEDDALRHGRATWVYEYPSAQVHSAAGDYVVWHKQGDDCLLWQVLTGGGETGRLVDKMQVLEVSRLVETAGPIKIETMHVNEQGILHVLMWVRDNQYMYGARRKNVVYSLPENKILWGDTCTLLPRQMIPLAISTTRMYYLAFSKMPDPTVSAQSRHPSLMVTTSLAACHVRTGHLLYSTHLLNEPPASVATTDFRVLHLQDREYIIQFGSHRQPGAPNSLLYEEFAIIDASTGHTIQRIRHAGAKAQGVFPKPKSNTFALWTAPRYHMELVGSPNLFHEPGVMFGLIYTYALQPDNQTFALVDLISVRSPIQTAPGAFVIHPFTHLGFFINSVGFRCLTTEKRQEHPPHDPPTWSFSLGGSTRVPVSGKYEIVRTENVTLSPKGSPGELGERRPCDVCFKGIAYPFYPPSVGQSLVLLSETKVLYVDRSGAEALYVFCFGPTW